MLKKYLLLVGVLLCIFTLSACKGKDTSTNSDGVDLPNTTVTPQADAEEDTAEAVDEADIAAGDAAVEDTDEKAVETVALEDQKHLITVKFESKLLSYALVKGTPTKETLIYLPPSYYSSEKRYPVVYFFHGFSESPYYVRSSEKVFTKLMQEAQMKEFIVVGVDGRTKGTDGSFFANSSVTGQWEDYVVNEIIPYIDENYRTIAKAESRGTAGFSMGGFACLNLAFLYPDTFSSVLSLCPGLLKDGSLEIAMKSWNGDSQFLKCYGQTFSPNPDSKSLGDIPKMDGSEADAVIRDHWENGFGKLQEKIDNYQALNQSLNKIEIIFGSSDSYKWIPEGSKYFSELLTAEGIEHTLIEIPGGHTIPGNYTEEYFVPFFSEALSFEE